LQLQLRGAREPLAEMARDPQMLPAGKAGAVSTVRASRANSPRPATKEAGAGMRLEGAADAGRAAQASAAISTARPIARARGSSEAISTSFRIRRSRNARPPEPTP
jgi:hypothetical protein